MNRLILDQNQKFRKGVYLQASSPASLETYPF